ncbi:hypothetical protein CPB83DRAFT_856844 [Crepidotus variabilis]|uniref:Uncharacterized protein n=1 Tax=Crepidotus variabilis TaxID=179855 RepID=A0A9P6EDT9_9AGAR|nr:hypothetical protein CPB83DRAFT_856844 [Crepidotus variabilis]
MCRQPHFREAGLSANAVNGNTWDERLQEDLKNCRFQGTFASPKNVPITQRLLPISSATKLRDICTITSSTKRTV